jgi:hypothetical protein
MAIRGMLEDQESSTGHKSLDLASGSMGRGVLKPFRHRYSTPVELRLRESPSVDCETPTIEGPNLVIYWGSRKRRNVCGRNNLRFRRRRFTYLYAEIPSVDVTCWAVWRTPHPRSPGTFYVYLVWTP